MLQEIIKSTPLTTQSADHAFANKISGDTFNGDQSLVALARALYGKRLKEGEQIRIRSANASYGQKVDYDFLEGIVSGLHAGDFQIVSLPRGTSNSGDWIQDARQAMSGLGLYEIEALSRWFESSSIRALVYAERPFDPKIPQSPVNSTKSIVLIENMTVARWHAMGIVMPRLLSAWFQDCPRTTEETAFVKSLNDKTPDRFLDYLRTCANEYDFRTDMIKNLLSDFEVKHTKLKIRAAEDHLADIERHIKDVMATLGVYLRNKDEALAVLDGYQSRAAKDWEPETMNYFLANKHLYLQRVEDESLDFYVCSWLSNWDPEKASACFERGRSSGWLEYNANFDVSDEDALMLYRAIFLAETVRVQLWSHMELSLAGLNPLQILSDNKIPDIVNALPNPHHHYNTCGGANLAYVAQSIVDGNIVGALEQCVSATGGINLVEHVSYRHFSRDLFDPRFGQVIYINETKQFVTTKEAIEWLKSKKEGATNE